MIGALAREESGFTLVELIVTVAIGMVVLIGLFGLVDVTLRANKRVEDRTESAQRGRIALEQMQRDLRSQVCIKTGATSALSSIDSGDDTQVTFYTDLTAPSGYTTTAFSPDQYQLSYSSTGTGSITETIRGGTGAYPNLTFPSVTATNTLITNVAQRKNGATNVPVFRYYARQSDGTLNPTPLPTPLTAASAATVVAIDVAFVAGPLRANADSRVKSAFDNTVYTRLPSDAQPQNGAQCQV